jgi:hypothetical protein
MPPRRRRDKLVANSTMEEEMRKFRAILDAMETTQRREPDAGDVSEAESEEMEFEGDAEEILLKAVANMGAREKMEIPMYEGKLDVEELLDWIRALDKYFDYEEIEDEKKVKHDVSRLKGHAML